MICSREIQSIRWLDKSTDTLVITSTMSPIVELPCLNSLSLEPNFLLLEFPRDNLRESRGPLRNRVS